LKRRLVKRPTTMNVESSTDYHRRADAGARVSGTGRAVTLS
jgi:hypothetical protein